MSATPRSTPTSAVRPNAIREILARMECMGPQVQSLAGGVPGVHAYPHGYERLLRRNLCGASGAGAIMNYADPRGHPALRSRVAALARSWGIDSSKRELLVTSGGQQGLYLAVRTLLQPGDAVVVPKPTYPGVLHLMQLCGMVVWEAATDEDGLLVDEALDAQFAAGARCLYLIADFDNPTGATLPESRRAALVELAAKHNAWIIEDLAYRELRYEGKALAPLAATSRADAVSRVVSVGSFSKSVMPSLRIGWVSAAPALVHAMAQHLQAQQLTGSNPIQLALADFLDDGYAQHLEMARASYRSRRDALVVALGQHMPRAQFAAPQGGFFLKLNLEFCVDETALFECALEQEQVACIPGAAFTASGQAGGFLRLCFSSLDEAELVCAAERLGRAYGSVRARPSTSLPAQPTP